jgi:hypothetical protein
VISRTQFAARLITHRNLRTPATAKTRPAGEVAATTFADWFTLEPVRQNFSEFAEHFVHLFAIASSA